MKLKIKVIASSSQDSVSDLSGDTLKIKVKAPPENGRANKAVIKLIEKTLCLPAKSITICSGYTSAFKIIEITGLHEDIVQKKLDDIYKLHP